jgi:methylamine--corrinoid protein Co-methyltransferase
MTAKRYLDVFEAYDRFINGDPIPEKDWDYSLIPINASLMKQRYKIDFGDRIIPEDQDLVDRLFLAGVDMLLTCGMYNKDTGTRMRLTEDEIYEGIKLAPTSMKIGEGKDSETCSLRRGNSPVKPVIQGGPSGTTVSEDIFVPVMESYAQEPIVDAVVTGALRTIKGQAASKGTPWEIRATVMELNYTRNALNNVGRTGLAI